MSDCLVVGGGIIGLMSARVLAMSGADVVLLEQNACGKQSSWAAGGILSPLYPWHYDDEINALSFESQAIYQQLCADLLGSTGIDPEYQKTGLLMLDEFGSPSAKAWLKKYQINFQKQPPGALFADIATVRNPRLLQALRADISNKKVQIFENIQAENLLIKGKKLLGINTSAGEFLADNIIICAGAWSSKLLDLPEPIFPIKGQMISLKAKPDAVKHIILENGKYIIPRADGQILIGSTMENVGFNSAVDEATKQNLYDFVLRHFPSLKTAKIQHHWSGFRPATKSGKVMIKRDKNYHNLFINTGHFRNGLSLAPASANRVLGLINE